MEVEQEARWQLEWERPQELSKRCLEAGEIQAAQQVPAAWAELVSAQSHSQALSQEPSGAWQLEAQPQEVLPGTQQAQKEPQQYGERPEDPKKVHHPAQRRKV